MVRRHASSLGLDSGFRVLDASDAAEQAADDPPSHERIAVWRPTVTLVVGAHLLIERCVRERDHLDSGVLKQLAGHTDDHDVDMGSARE
jgi:hypothetical protein